jgi:hypothetical protein
MKNVRMNKAQRRLARKFGRRIWKHFSGGRFYKSSTLKLIRKTLRSCRK